MWREKGVRIVVWFLLLNNREVSLRASPKSSTQTVQSSYQESIGEPGVYRICPFKK